MPRASQRCPIFHSHFSAVRTCSEYHGRAGPLLGAHAQSHSGKARLSTLHGPCPSSVSTASGSLPEAPERSNGARQTLLMLCPSVRSVFPVRASRRYCRTVGVSQPSHPFTHIRRRPVQVSYPPCTAVLVLYVCDKESSKAHRSSSFVLTKPIRIEPWLL